MNYQLDFIVKATSGQLLSSPHSQFSGYSTDNRDPNIKDHLFIPLVGDVHDAHQYVSSAITAGATGVIVHQWLAEWDSYKDKVSFIQVEDTLKALQDLARQWRQSFQGKVLALTGSNGKTTTKDFLFQILQNFGSVHSSQGSFNNHWGVPFTLLDTDPSQDFCVVEMGMNHAGEIVQLMKIADPDLVTVTNVGRAHMGNFANGIEGVAAAKEEIYENAKATAQLVFNIDNNWTREMYQKYMDRPSYTYSTKNFSADVYFKVRKKSEKGLEVEGQIGGVLGKTQLQFWGDHNIENLAAAVAMAYIAGCRPEKIWPVLSNCHCGWGRNQWLDTSQGVRILFDGYNANPDSFQQLLTNVQPLFDSHKLVAVFGEMLELGENSEHQHYELGKAASALHWQQCIFIGPSGPAFARGWQAGGGSKNLVILNTYKESLDLDLSSMVDSQSLVIVKGSRGGALERIVERFEPINFASK